MTDAYSVSGIALDDALAALRRHDPSARAFWLYDVDAFRARAARLLGAFGREGVHVAYALKANGCGALVRAARESGLDADAGSIGELELAAAYGYDAAHLTLSGNGRTREEAAWVCARGVAAVSADHVGELDLLEGAAAGAGITLRVALRVNPGIATPGHKYVATGGHDAKFGVSAEEALAAWEGRARWPHLRLDGLHLHVGSQLLDTAPLEAAARAARELADASRARGAALGLVNLGGGFGVDYDQGTREFPVEAWAERLGAHVRASGIEWRIEPGRWLVAPIGTLVAEVLWEKRRAEDGTVHRFVVLAAGMNDLLRPALYGARHRAVPVRPRAGALTAAAVVGPVCESGDTFEEGAMLPPLERGDLVALLDAGAYGAAMSSQYNGRGRLAEVVIDGGALTLARRAEVAADLRVRDCDVRLS